MHKEEPVPASTDRWCCAIPSVHEVVSTEFWQDTIDGQKMRTWGVNSFLILFAFKNHGMLLDRLQSGALIKIILS